MAGITTDDAARLARERFSLAGSATALPGMLDANFRLDLDGGGRRLLKVVTDAESVGALARQDAALRLLERSDVASLVPRLVDEAEDGGRRVRLLTWLEGTKLVDVRPHEPALLERIGATLAAIDEALRPLDGPEHERPHDWNLERGFDVVRDRLDAVDDPARRDRLGALLEALERDLLPLAGRLPRAVIHGDANDHNLLVDVRPADAARLSGLIDFGDLSRSWRAAEPAIAIAYVMLDKVDPLGAAAAIVRGYHGRRPLDEVEVDALFDLARLRLAVSVAMSAAQRKADPENAYLAVSEAPVWRLLERLERTPPALARAVLRHAAGLEPCARTATIRDRLAALDAAPVLPFDLTTFPVVPLSVDAPAVLDALPVRAIGRYDEARLCYATPSYEEPSDDHPESRTVHLGVDLFAEAGTEVRAPLDGVVHSFADNDRPLDYGPTILLRHDLGDGVALVTLYGHLSRDSLEGLEVGAAIRRGAPFARLGTGRENGGWPPHLHFQLIADDLGHVGDFPGAAAPRLRDVFGSLSPDPSLLLDLPPGARAPRPTSPDALLAARRERLGPSLSVSYRRPLHIVRGEGAHLIDAEGRRYLDGVNNVCHVGHARPEVVEALARQAALLNTNTRYLHENVLRYAERLAATFPDPLSVCYFVNSGSEANELALRLARAHTGARDVVALDAAYHGHTQALIDVGAYKHAGRGGSGPPPWVHVAPRPDRYRGKHREGDGDLGALYAAEVESLVQAIVAAGRRPAAFLAESVLSCGGQIVLPDGFLRRVYDTVRAAGGVTIADEVQVGFGRVGTHAWGFELQGVVPDVVTLGKPIGNGHPLAAVVTTPEIARSFANGMEYFNTFGGNPVSCAVGLAVLDVLERDRLREHAHRLGGRLLAGFETLKERHALVGDVRGAGLFLGVELVLDREARTPAPAHAARVCERLRDRGILLSTDGPDANVLKVKPPLVVSEADADRLVETLDAVLAESALRAI
ncbi:MAG: aminotransferase class III-fold pyridoxal phosphate-dependent enzyme [Planctomycetota bacterium JB042]